MEKARQVVILSMLGDIKFFPGVHGIHGKLFENEGGNHMLAMKEMHYNSKSCCSQRLGRILEVFALKC